MPEYNELARGDWKRPTTKSLIDGFNIENRYKLIGVLSRKLQNIPAGMMSLPRKPGSTAVPSKDDLTITDVLDHNTKAINLPHIPPDIRLEFLLRNRATIDEQGRLAIKDEKAQHIDITRAIFFWRLDEAHQFQRFHDNARWNIALFIALLTDKHSEATVSDPARGFAIAYLAAVLEHHNDPGKFDKRESFVKLWKHSKYDFFFFAASQKLVLKRETKRLKKEWADELSRVRYGSVLGKQMTVAMANYNAKVAKFVGVLIPGKPILRLPNFCPPDVAIKDLQAQSDISARNMQKNALLEALIAQAEDYSVSAIPTTMLDQEQAPQEDVDYAFTQAEPSTLAPEGQHSSLLNGASDYPALHFPKISRFDVNNDAITIVDKKAAMSALKKTKPRAILAKLMELFPEKTPYAEYLEAPTEQTVMRQTPEMTWEQSLEAWKAESARRYMPASRGLPVRLASASASIAQPSSSQSEPPQLDQYMMEVDDSVLQSEATWEISAEVPMRASRSIFGGDSLFGGGE